ncbi:F-box only protein 30b isoform X2 [Vanacampus margaritifer]
MKVFQMAEEHAHCMSCVNRRCMIRPQPGVSCQLTGCPLLCGAVFHSCKAEEHHHLCPLLRVPCLNSTYGCPVAMARNQMSAHLEVCPAGVVFCSMEWNHPADIDRDYSSYEPLSRVEEVEHLKIAVALQDQRTLLESLRMIAVAPTIKRVLPNLTIQIGRASEPGSSASSETRAETARERIASGINGLNEQHDAKLNKVTLETLRNLVIALELVGGASSSDCRAEGVRAEAAMQASRLDKLLQLQNGRTADEAMEESSLTIGCLEMLVQEDLVASQDVAMSSLHDAEAAAQTKILDSVLDLVSGANLASSPADGVRLEATQHARRMDGLVQFQIGRTADESMEETRLMNGCLEIAAPRDVIMSPMRAHAVLEDGEPEEWMLPTGHSPSTSQSQSETKAVDTSDLEGSSKECTVCRRIWDTIRVVGGCIHSGTALLVTDMRAHAVLEDREPEKRMLPTGQSPSTSQSQSETKTEDKAVDTSDLEQDDDDTVMFCLDESSSECTVHIRSPVDGGRIHSGAETFSFQLALVVTDMRVGDAASASACDHASPQNACPFAIHTVRHKLGPDPLLENGYSIPFMCAQSFRRDEFPSHYTNVHRDIYDGLNGWIEHRCPLAFYGCTFSQRRFYPTSSGAKVVHDRLLRSFGVQPQPGAKLSGDSHSDQFSGLPTEILCHIAGFLDGFSLCQLSLVSHTMRGVCSSLVQARGIVELQWEKRRCSSGHRRVSWQVKQKVWRFSTVFSPVLRWGSTDVPSMSNHLKVCRYNTAVHRTEPVPLTAMGLGQEHLTKLPKFQRPIDLQ